MKPVLKLILIGLLLLVLGVPVMMLHGLVWERQQRGREVAAEIANSSSRAQTVAGPLLRVVIDRNLRRRRMVGEGGTLRSEEEIVRESEVRLLTPTQLQVEGDLGTELRRRGLFEARVYGVKLGIRAEFSPLVLPPPGEDVVDQRIVEAAVVLGLSDARGIRAIGARLGEQALNPEPGTGVGWLAAGLQLPLPPEALGVPMTLALDLDLAGTESLHWLPVGDDTRVTLRGDWPHPSFEGQFLPVQRQVEGDAADPALRGFTAEWRVSRLASQTPQAVRDCAAEATSCVATHDAGFGLRLIDPVDRYLKTERAIKYAWLFIVLVFGALFFLELLRPVRVHPLQYGLTGLALAMFFLLLLSLAEHIGFAPAYGVAAISCVALIATYMATPLGSRRNALGFAGLLAGLYALLYGLLQSEDYALLMGALTLFALLATAMLLTRRLDWYRLGENAASRAG